MPKRIKPINTEELKIPAYMRKKSLVSQSRQQLILTALDRKEARLKPNSKVATAPLPKRPTGQQNPLISRMRRDFNQVEQIQKEQSAHQLSRSINSFPGEDIPEEAPSFTKPQKMMQAGEVTHYIENIQVAIILLKKRGVKQGDTLLIEGEDCMAVQPIEEMQIDRKPVARAKKGSHIGLKVKFPTSVGAKVYKAN